MKNTNFWPPQPCRGWKYSGNFVAPNFITRGDMTTYFNFNPPLSLPPPLPSSQGKNGGTFLAPKPNWKHRKGDQRKASRRTSNYGGAGRWRSLVRTYEPQSRLKDLQVKTHLKSRSHYPKKKKKKNKFNRYDIPSAPRNTTSFLIRAKQGSGISSLVSPAREGFIDLGNEEWGVNGYGSMNGLLPLRFPGIDAEPTDNDSSSVIHVERYMEAERKLDHDLTRFEMISPSMSSVHVHRANGLLETRVGDPGKHIAHLEEEKLALKERLSRMQKEMHDLRRRLQHLEGGNAFNHYQHENKINVVISDNGGLDKHTLEVCSDDSVGN
eukprot:Gb_06501 [translate_table: standard]